MQQAVAPKIRFVSGCEAIFKTPVWLGTGNEMTQETIAAAGNVEVPAYLTLVALGFRSIVLTRMAKTAGSRTKEHSSSLPIPR